MLTAFLEPSVGSETIQPRGVSEVSHGIHDYTMNSVQEYYRISLSNSPGLISFFVVKGGTYLEGEGGGAYKCMVQMCSRW